MKLNGNLINGRKPPPGFTLTEVLISVLLVSVLVIGFERVFRVSSRGMTVNDAKEQLKQLGEKVTVRITNNLKQSRRVYSRLFTFVSPPTYLLTDPYSGAIDLSASPPPLSGTQLFSLNPSTASYGNALFFVKQLSPMAFPRVPEPIQADVFQFFYYYLALAPGERPVSNAPCRHLYEWRSIRYADYESLLDLPGAAGATSPRSVAAQGLLDQGIDTAYNVTVLDINNAFSRITMVGGFAVFTPLPGYKIKRHGLECLTKSLGGRVIFGYQTSVSPNLSALAKPLTFPPSQRFVTIPISGWNTRWIGDSPSGFESFYTPWSSGLGSNTINIRIVLVAQGPFPETLGYIAGGMANTRDVW